MKQPTMIRLISCVMLLIVGSTLLGCSSQPASTPADVQTKEQDAKEKMKDAYANDPALRGPSAGKVPAGANMTPGPVPGAGQ